MEPNGPKTPPPSPNKAQKLAISPGTWVRLGELLGDDADGCCLSYNDTGEQQIFVQCRPLRLHSTSWHSVLTPVRQKTFGLPPVHSGDYSAEPHINEGALELLRASGIEHIPPFDATACRALMKIPQSFCQFFNPLPVMTCPELSAVPFPDSPEWHNPFSVKLSTHPAPPFMHHPPMDLGRGVYAWKMYPPTMESFSTLMTAMVFNTGNMNTSDLAKHLQVLAKGVPCSQCNVADQYTWLVQIPRSTTFLGWPHLMRSDHGYHSPVLPVRVLNLTPAVLLCILVEYCPETCMQGNPPYNSVHRRLFMLGTGFSDELYLPPMTRVLCVYASFGEAVIQYSLLLHSYHLEWVRRIITVESNYNAMQYCNVLSDREPWTNPPYLSNLIFAVDCEWQINPINYHFARLDPVNIKYNWTKNFAPLRGSTGLAYEPYSSLPVGKSIRAVEVKQYRYYLQPPMYGQFPWTKYYTTNSIVPVQEPYSWELRSGMLQWPIKVPMPQVAWTMMPVMVRFARPKMMYRMNGVDVLDALQQCIGDLSMDSVRAVAHIHCAVDTITVIGHFCYKQYFPSMLWMPHYATLAGDGCVVIQDHNLWRNYFCVEVVPLYMMCLEYDDLDLLMQISVPPFWLPGSFD